MLLVLNSTSLYCYVSTLRPVCFAPLLIFAYSRSNNTNQRCTALALFLTLGLTFGTLSLLISGTAQLFPSFLKQSWKNTRTHARTHAHTHTISLSHSEHSRPTSVSSISSCCTYGFCKYRPKSSKNERNVI